MKVNIQASLLMQVVVVICLTSRLMFFGQELVEFLSARPGKSPRVSMVLSNEANWSNIITFKAFLVGQSVQKGRSLGSVCVLSASLLPRHFVCDRFVAGRRTWRLSVFTSATKLLTER